MSVLKYLVEKSSPSSNFYRADYPCLNAKLLDVEWQIELSGLDSNGVVNWFYEIFDSFIKEIPKVLYTRSGTTQHTESEIKVKE